MNKHVLWKKPTLAKSHLITFRIIMLLLLHQGESIHTHFIIRALKPLARMLLEWSVFCTKYAMFMYHCEQEISCPQFYAAAYHKLLIKALNWDKLSFDDEGSGRVHLGALYDPGSKTTAWLSQARWMCQEHYTVPWARREVGNHKNRNCSRYIFSVTA